MQKKSYKILAYLCELRPDYMDEHVQEVLDVLQSSKSSMGKQAWPGPRASAAERGRLGCLYGHCLSGGPIPLLSGRATSLSAARRYRLRCLKAVTLILLDQDEFEVSPSADDEPRSTREVTAQDFNPSQSLAALPVGHSCGPISGLCPAGGGLAAVRTHPWSEGGEQEDPRSRLPALGRGGWAHARSRATKHRHGSGSSWCVRAVHRSSERR